ncbi:MAG: NAD-dependent epimerase/dehydratase family protein [Candidatus Ozemobacteraceae bacterium]
MKRVVVTGGTGFIGANLVRRLLGEGHSVHLFLRPESPRWRVQGLSSTLQFHEVSLEEKSSLLECIKSIHPDWIFHLATYGGSSWQTEQEKIVRTNLLGTMNLLDSCMEIGFEAFINTGSSSEYGFKNYPPKETDLLEPNSCYAITKAGATQYCQHIGKTCGAHIVTLRLYSAFGPFEQPKRLVPTLILRGLEGKFPPFTAPEVARDFVYIEDVIDAFLLSAKAQGIEPGGIFNIGSGIQTTMKEVAAVAKKVFAIPHEPSWNTMKSRNWDTGTWVSDNQKAREILKWSPVISFENGLKQMVAWFKENPNLRAEYNF